MNVFIFSAGILCLTYYIVIIIHAGITADFAWIWPAGTVLLWGWCLVSVEQVFRVIKTFIVSAQ